MNPGFELSKIIPAQFMDRFYLIGLVICAIGVIFFLRYFIKAITISIQRILHPLPWYSESLSKIFLYSLLFVGVACIGLVWMYMGSLMQTYQPIEKAVAVGTIEIKKESVDRFSAKFISSYENFPRTTIVKQMHGNQWAVAGAFLNFPNFMSYLGVRDGHQVLDIMSKQIMTLRVPEMEYMKQIETQPDIVWRIVSKFQGSSGTKKADFHISPLMYATDGTYELYAATSGYVVTNISKKKIKHEN
jgi:hypothetical protein